MTPPAELDEAPEARELEDGGASPKTAGPSPPLASASSSTDPAASPTPRSPLRGLHEAGLEISRSISRLFGGALDGGGQKAEAAQGDGGGSTAGEEADEEWSPSAGPDGGFVRTSSVQLDGAPDSPSKRVALLNKSFDALGDIGANIKLPDPASLDRVQELPPMPRLATLPTTAT